MIDGVCRVKHKNIARNISHSWLNDFLFFMSWPLCTFSSMVTNQNRLPTQKYDEHASSPVCQIIIDLIKARCKVKPLPEISDDGTVCLSVCLYHVS